MRRLFCFDISSMVFVCFDCSAWTPGQLLRPPSGGPETGWRFRLVLLVPHGTMVLRWAGTWRAHAAPVLVAGRSGRQEGLLRTRSAAGVGSISAWTRRRRTPNRKCVRVTGNETILWKEEDGPIRGQAALGLMLRQTPPPQCVAVLYSVVCVRACVSVCACVCVNTVQRNYFKEPVGCCSISYSSFCLVASASVFLLLLI